MGFADQIRAAKAKALGNAGAAVRQTIEAAADRVIIDSPVGDPALWKDPYSAPPGYVGGEFRSNWVYAVGEPSNEFRPHVTNVTVVNGLAAMPANVLGLKHFISNADPKGPSLEYGHSSQAPNGLVGVLSIELPGIAENIARKVAG